MKFLLFILTLFSLNVFCSTLEFKKDGKLIKSFSLDKIKKAKVLKIKAQQVTLYNAWRGYSRTYEGYEFFKLLDNTYGKSWKRAELLSFKALDGYTTSVKVKAMIRASVGKLGLLAYKEKNIDGFTMLNKGKRVIDPGPLYLVWSNFTSDEKVTHEDILKWPYQLKEINIIY